MKTQQRLRGARYSKGLSLDCSSTNSPPNYHQMIRCDSYHHTHFTYKKPKAPVLGLPPPQAHINGKGKRNSSPGHLIPSQKCLSTATGHLPNSLCKFNHCLPTLATPASELINLLCISSRGGGDGWVAGEDNLFTVSVSPRGTACERDFLAIPQDGILRFGMASCLYFWLYAWTFSWCEICGQIYLLVWKLTVVILAFVPNKLRQRLCTELTISAVLLCLDTPHTESHLTHHMWLEKPTVPASLLGIR